MKNFSYATKNRDCSQANTGAGTTLKWGLLFLTILLCLPSSPARARTHTALEIMEKVDKRDDGDRSVADMRMLLIDRNGKQRSRSLHSFDMDKGEDRYNLIFFLTPGDVKGTGFLTYDYDAEGKDDDQWLYLPALKKVKRIASNDKSGSFMGSDFSYADLTKTRLHDYTYTFYEKQPEVVVDEQKCWVIESVPKTRKVITETGYTKSILFVRRDNMVVTRAIYYLQDSGALKYFDVKKMEKIDEIWTALEIHMTRKKGGKTVHRTILNFDNVQYNQEMVDETMFSTRRLEKGL